MKKIIVLLVLFFISVPFSNVNSAETLYIYEDNIYAQVTSSNTSVNWATNKEANCNVVYGETTNLVNTSGEGNSMSGFGELVEVGSNFSDGKYYYTIDIEPSNENYFKIMCVDDLGIMKDSSIYHLRPDLVIEDLSYENQLVKFKYCNKGAVSYQQTNNIFYVKMDINGVAYDGETGSGTYPFSIPESGECIYSDGYPISLFNMTAGGDFMVDATIDYENSISESDETNNVYTERLGLNKVDLTVQDITFIDLEGSNVNDVRIIFKALNIGEETPSEPFNILARNLSNGKSIGEITPGYSDYVTNRYQITGNYFEGKVGDTFINGTNRIQVCVDSNDAITEIYENNNCYIKEFKYPQTSVVDRTLSKRLAGRILLQTQKGGAIWYVDHTNNRKHSVTWDNAMPLFEKFALGITNRDLLKIKADYSSINPQLDTDGDGYVDIKELENGYSPYSNVSGKYSLDNSLGQRLKGRLLLQVEGGGAIWYVDQEGVRHNVRWGNLMDIFRKLALGITDSDLDKIEVGD